MDLFQKTKQICQENNIKPARSKGQNFLIYEEVYDRIVEAAAIDKDDTVLEVGPGLGFLTEKLAAKAGKVVAVEIDDVLAAYLGKRFVGVGNVEVVNEDILKISKSKFLVSNKNDNKRPFRNYYLEISNYKVVANLPYNITSVFLRKFLEAENRPVSMTLMLQREVAERICAKPGEMSLLGVSVQFYADARIVEYVPKKAFWPEPEVDSAVVYFDGITRKRQKNTEYEKEFFRLTRIGFSARRKMLKNNLANGYHVSQTEAEEWIKKAGFNGKIRAQELGVDDWVKLFGVCG